MSFEANQSTTRTRRPLKPAEGILIGDAVVISDYRPGGATITEVVPTPPSAEEAA